ncbi:MAG: metallophosphoesterase [Candidatus Marinimicrobia bacterium]|nr:metallophosphoesterase [Candidatus Neomarinimicrobiota bacterium]
MKLRHFLILLLFTLSLVQAGHSSAGHDTLTIIQYPIINVPLLALPGDSIPVDISLSPAEAVVSVSLILRGHRTGLEFFEVPDDAVNGLRRVRAVLPESMIYGLYDLAVSCSGEIDEDVSEHAVYIIPEYKNDFTFIHITDTHLPSHYFWGDSGVETDSTELEDFRAVIDDINIIHPEFVLHTGDLINDGELEALGIPAISRAKKILHELEVPLFLVGGNHDLGGWDATPAPTGTARTTWWKYFGWKYLDNTSPGALITQDYSFNYGDIHFAGMEAYTLYGSYDGWRDNLYGSTSFTSGQLQWLADDLAEHASAALNILFYHNDFDGDLNLSSLGVDAAFWGHIHRNTGDMTVPPYNSSTGSTCDGNRWYRIVRVQNNAIVSMQAIQAGVYGEAIIKTVNAAGSMVRITNNTGIGLQKCLITFTLEEGKMLSSLNNAYLMQVDTLNSPHTVYAYVNVPAHSFIDASISVEDIPEMAVEETVPDAFSLSIYPNPFNPLLIAAVSLPNAMNVTVTVYNVEGKAMHRFPSRPYSKGLHRLRWNGEAHPSGLYFLVCEALSTTEKYKAVKKCLLLK